MSTASRSVDEDEIHKVLLGDAIGAVQGGVDTVTSVVSLVQPAYESDAMQTVRDGVNKLIDSLPGLLKALDGLAQVHPFIAGESVSS